MKKLTLITLVLLFTGASFAGDCPNSDVGRNTQSVGSSNTGGTQSPNTTTGQK